jgi:hypothetical protein
MNKKINFSIPFSKVDDEQRTVTGIATAEVLDHQNEIVDYEASKKAFTEWKGNIREMHGDKAVGKRIDMQFDDANQAVILTSKVSESADGENAWIKIKEGVLTGYSIGGAVFDIVQETAKSDTGEDVNARRIKGYNLAEVSFVDSPACPVAEFLVVKRNDKGELIETEKMIEHEKPLPTLGWMKMFDYSIETHNAIEKAKKEQAEAPDLHEFAKAELPDELNKKDYSDKERKSMADKGEALPDGSFPIASVSDLKNAIKAFGRAKDPAKAKAHIKKRAKDLGATDLIPATWKAAEAEDIKKGDPPEGEENNEQPDKTPSSDEEDPPEPQDGDGQEDNKPEGEEQEVTPPATDAPVDPPATDPETPPAPEDPAPPVDDTDKADKNKDLRKDLYTVSSLAECLANLACIRDWCMMEQEWEGDDSTVPADLTAAIENLGEILQAMAVEEAAEAANNREGTPAEMFLADKGADLKKIEANMLETTQTMLDKQAELILGKVVDLVKPLADRVNQLANQPAATNRPVATYHEVDKGVGIPSAPSPAGDADAALAARWTELKETAAARKYDSSFTLSERQALVKEMWEVNKKLNKVTTADMNPELAKTFPYAFRRLS